ncbi:MAG: response regulator [Calditrichaeota bacterium]|nr:response regulator [Calditrichota bacterium]
MNRDKNYSSLNILLDNIEGPNLLLEYYTSFSNRLFAAKDFKGIIRILFQEIRKIYSRQKIEFILWQNKKKLLTFSDKPTPDGEYISEEMVELNTLYHYTLEQQQAILTNNYQNFCDTLGVHKNNIEASSWLGTPMQVHEKTLGMVAIWDENPEHYFRLQDKQFMSIITNITALAMENIFLYDYIREKNSAIENPQSQNLQPFSVELTDNLLEDLLKVITREPGVFSAGFFLRSQNHERWRLVGSVSTQSGMVDINESILKNLIYLSENNLKESVPLFWARGEKKGVLQKSFHEALENQPIQSLLLIPARIQRFYYGILAISYRNRSAIPSASELKPVNFLNRMIHQIIEKDLLSEHRQSYESYIQHLEKMKLVGELASASAHHLNNILSVITGRAQILQNKLKASPHLKDIAMIEQAAGDGAQAVRRLQSIKTQNFPVSRFELLSINDLILEVVEITRPRFEREAQSRGLTYDVKMTLGSAAYIKGDPAALREVFLNLINNALDAMPRGGKLTIQTTMEKDRVILFFSDTGEGIPEEMKEKIFQPFFSTKGAKGNGLGLSIAADIINMHQGKIYLDSILNKGSIFMVELPAVREKPADNSLEIPQNESIHCSVLLVDDEDVVGETLAEMLRQEGCDVVMVNTAARALEQFKKSPSDIVLTDLSMPGINGFELAKKIKELNRDVPVILITGWNQSDKNLFPNNGIIDASIEKPFNMKQIRQAFRRVLRKNGRTVPLKMS